MRSRVRLKASRAIAALTGLLLVGSPAAAAVPTAKMSYYQQKAVWAICDPGEPPEGMPEDVWKMIWKDLECADVVVPMDYRNPGAGNLTIAISRLKASDPARRQGVLLLNPGGPGGNGLLMPSFFRNDAIAKPFDLIGFDPRGVGRSTELSCEEPSSPPLVETRPTDDQFGRFAADALAQERACEQAGGGLRKFISTANTARDMDVIRAAIGEKKINYLGFSYGTYLGAAYGSLFPSKLNRSVLDSSMHPDWFYYEASKQQAVAARENVDAWAGWLAQRDSRYHFGKTAAEVRATLDAVRARLAKKPVPWPDAPPGYPDIDGSLFDMILGGASPSRPMWHELALLIGAVRDASQTTKNALTTSEGKAFRALYGVIKETYNGVFPAVTCEADWPKDLKVYEARMRIFRKKYPYGPGAMAAAPTNCTFRSFTPPEKLVDLKRAGYPTGLVVQAEFDPATQYDGGPAMAAKLNNNLISIKDEGSHGIYGGNACATKKIDDYLIKGILPGSRTVCPGAPRPDVPVDGARSGRTLTDTGPIDQRVAKIIKAGKLGRFR
ncbi:alpha/beta hydrolase [Kribbella sp. NBC_01245]|uniref:alpha/beta fold hydrolase n=1 Tax=Kribbella sp. NBC_01245 TaxID=2903578 RepID=UPI002E27EB9A|nr:alpha/beta fold hydrolase [Kribbella sp. NBC_01245]